MTLPKSFSGNTDSINSANINWKSYFSDTTLVTLIELGLQNNLDLLAALQKIEAARSYVKSAKGALLPTVSANAAYLQRKFGLYTMDGSGNIVTEITPGQIIPIHLPDYYLGLQTAWEVDIWGKLRNKRKAALTRYLASLEGKNLVITNLVAEIASSYYKLLQLDNELDIIRETVSLQKDALDLVLLQKEAGVTNELAVKQFSAQVLNSHGLEFETLQNINEYENKLNFLLNRYPQIVLRQKQHFTKPISFKLNVGIPSQLLYNRPDIRKAEFQLLAVKADLNAARAAFYPSFNITGTIGFQAFNPAYLFQTPQSMAYSLLGNLIAPLVNRAAIKSEFSRATASQQEAMINYQKSILTAFVEVHNEMARIKNLDSVSFNKTAEVNVLSEAIETSTELYKTGRATYIEVLLAQRNALISKLELIEVKRRRYNSFVDIYKALGGGWK